MKMRYFNISQPSSLNFFIFVNVKSDESRSVLIKGEPGALSFRLPHFLLLSQPLRDTGDS